MKTPADFCHSTVRKPDRFTPSRHKMERYLSRRLTSPTEKSRRAGGLVFPKEEGGSFHSECTNKQYTHARPTLKHEQSRSTITLWKSYKPKIKANKISKVNMWEIKAMSKEKRL